MGPNPILQQIKTLRLHQFHLYVLGTWLASCDTLPQVSCQRHISIDFEWAYGIINFFMRATHSDSHSFHTDARRLTGYTNGRTGTIWPMQVSWWIYIPVGNVDKISRWYNIWWSNWARFRPTCKAYSWLYVWEGEWSFSDLRFGQSHEAS